MTVIDEIMTLTLNTAVASGQPRAVNLECTVTLTDAAKKITSYTVQFQNSCNQTDTFAGTSDNQN
jgi:hypothetical protein